MFKSPLIYMICTIVALLLSILIQGGVIKTVIDITLMILVLLFIISMVKDSFKNQQV